MSIVVIVLSALFIALGAVPPIASSLATSMARESLEAPATVQLRAVPTWKLLTGEVDRLELVVGATKLGAVPISGISVQGGPCRLDAPCRLGAELAIATRDLQPLIEEGMTAYAEELAETFGVAGAQVADLAVTMAERTSVSGRFEAFGGLVSVPFHVEGRLARLGPQTVGLQAAVATINEQAQPLGDIAVWTLPEPPLEGLQVSLDRLAVEGDSLKAWLQLDIPHPADLL
jgi:hypothetical protein